MTDKDALSQEIAAVYDDDEITADSEIFQGAVATKYYDDQLKYESITQLVGTETAQRLRVLKVDLNEEPLNFAAPNDVDIYAGDATAVEAAADGDR